jgi:ADP-ribosyl-[dinitrogen reductase] hydrolase
MELPERLSGGVWGHLVGDALGVPYEFTSREGIGEVTWRGHGTYDQPPGTWSDDGALMLALLDSLLSVGFDPEDQGRRALRWRREGEYAPGNLVFDIGGATCMALSRLEGGIPAAEAGAADALGNGSLMRILPLALVLRDGPAAGLVRLAGIASGVTHGSAEARIACALYSVLVRRLLEGEEDRLAALEHAISSVREAPPEGTSSDDLDAFLAWTGRAGRGRVVDSFWSAWEAFAGADGYRDAVVSAVRYGNDTDTTAAIAGGLAGVRWGIDGIPREWLTGLRDRGMVQALVDRLVETDGWRTSTSSPLRLDPLDLSGLDGLDRSGGQVRLTFLPGRQRHGALGKHWRDLDIDAARIRREYGAKVLVLFVEDHELDWCRAWRIAEVLESHGIELIRHPISDPVGFSADPEGYRALVRAMLDRVRAGETVAIACRGGVDRTGTMAGCMLREAGAGPDEAIERVHRARRRTLTRPDQQRFVRDWRPT